MKPLSSCALFGATRALSGIRDALILQHSVVGCQWGSLAFRYAGKPYNVRQSSTVVYENDVIEGGDSLLLQAMEQAELLFPQCGAVFVVSGCVPNMIGDDVEGVLHEYAGRQQFIHVKAPGYVGNIDSGIEAAYLSLLRLMLTQDRVSRPSLNILGIMNDDPYADNDYRELRRCLNGKVDICCNLQDCTLADIERMPQAALNLCFGYGVPLAQKMKESFGTPYIQCDYPYGVAGMQELLRSIEQALMIDFSDVITSLELEGQDLVYRCADYLIILYQQPVVIAADKAHLVGMQNFLRDELGMRVILVKDTSEYTLNELTAACEELQPALICGSSFLKQLAEGRQLPLLRFVYPMFDRLCLSENCCVGAKGAAHIIEEVVNAALQQCYKQGGLYAPLREFVCERQKEEKL